MEGMQITERSKQLISKDVELLERYGIDGLKQKGYYGIIQRLAETWIIDYDFEENIDTIN